MIRSLVRGYLGAAWLFTLIAAVSLAACGTPASTPAGSGGPGGGSVSTATSAVATSSVTATPTAISTATPEATPTEASASPAASAMSEQEYASSLVQISQTSESLTHEELSLVAAGVDDSTIESQIEADLPARQNLLMQLEALNPPDNLMTLHEALVNTMQRQITAMQQVVDGQQSDDQAQIDAGMKLLVNNQLDQLYCGSDNPQNALTSMFGLPTPTTGATPTVPESALPLVSYFRAIQPVLTDYAKQFKSLCQFDPAADTDSPAYYAQLQQIIPALQADADQLGAVVPPDAMKDFHRLYSEAFQKFTQSIELTVQSHQQNDASLEKQARAVMAQGELDVLDAQKAMLSGIMNMATNP